MTAHANSGETVTHPARRIRLDDLPDLVGTRLATSASITITQERIEAFADATDDHQWLHTDRSRAKSGPFGGTIAHGYLTLSLFTTLLWSAVDIVDAASVVNYGLNKVRFPAPLLAGSVLSMAVDLSDITAIPDGYRVSVRGTMTTPGQPKPVCVAEALFNYHRATPTTDPRSASETHPEAIKP